MKRMSLLNPDQLQHYGVTVSDDPTDSTRHQKVAGFTCNKFGMCTVNFKSSTVRNIFSVVQCMTLCTIPCTCVPSHGSPNILPFAYHSC